MNALRVDSGGVLASGPDATRVRDFSGPSRVPASPRVSSVLCVPVWSRPCLFVGRSKGVDRKALTHAERVDRRHGGEAAGARYAAPRDFTHGSRSVSVPRTTRPGAGRPGRPAGGVAGQQHHFIGDERPQGSRGGAVRPGHPRDGATPRKHLGRRRTRRRRAKRKADGTQPALRWSLWLVNVNASKRRDCRATGHGGLAVHLGRARTARMGQR